MCGFELWLGSKAIRDLDYEWLKRRGPDYFSISNFQHHDLYIQIAASVLHIQGLELQQQPIELENGDLFFWNGELFESFIPKEKNDGNYLSQLISEIGIRAFCNRLAMMDGDWAFLYYQRQANLIYFGRDYLGKRSLLYYINEEQFALSSTGRGEGWQDVPADGIFILDLNAIPKSIDELKIMKWKKDLPVPFSSENFLSTVEIPPIPPYEPSDYFPLPKPPQKEILKENLDILIKSIRIRIEKTLHQNYCSVLFSGGIDCSLLTALLSYLLPPEVEIELWNVSFCYQGKFESPDRQTAQQSFSTLQKLFPLRRFHLCLVDVTEEMYSTAKPEILKLIYPYTTQLDLSIASCLYFASCGLGKVNGSDYKTKSKTIWSGLGPDELFGGYSSHFNLFNKETDQKYEKLNDALIFSLMDLPNRNLSRDNRVISHQSLELITPYLSHPYIQHCLRIPVQWKCDLRKQVERKIGGKLFIRWLWVYFCLEYLNNRNIGQIGWEEKRAMQFGTRSSKMEKGGTGKTNLWPNQ